MRLPMRLQESRENYREDLGVHNKVNDKTANMKWIMQDSMNICTEKGLERPCSSLPGVKEIYGKKGERILTRKCCDRTRGNCFKPKKVDLD